MMCAPPVGCWQSLIFGYIGDKVRDGTLSVDAYVYRSIQLTSHVSVWTRILSAVITVHHGHSHRFVWMHPQLL